MSFFKKIFKFKNLLKAAAIAAAAYTGGTSLGLIGGAGAAGAAGTAGTLGSLLSTAGTIGSAVQGVGTLASLAQGEPKISQPTITPAQAPAFNPIRPTALALPSSLSSLGGMDENQRRSSLATMGLEQGLGSEEEAYYNNLVQRSLIDDKNSVGSINSLLPIEQQYYKRKGYNSSDPYELLRSLQQG